MRQGLLPLIFILLLLAVTPAQAGGALPLVGFTQAGPYRVSIHNDSPGLRIGKNQITVEIDGKPSAISVALRLTGPQGQVVRVPLQNLRTLGGPVDDHSSHATAPAGGSLVPSPATTSAATAEAATHEHGTGTFMARGRASLNTGGNWTAEVDIFSQTGAKTSTQLPVIVTRDEPSPVYLSLAGLLMGGSVLYGISQRRRRVGVPACSHYAGGR